MKQRVHVITTVNARNVSKDGGIYTIRDVCGAVDGIVMNGMLYPGDQLAPAAASLNGKPAPAGHPKNTAGQYISATNGDALLTCYVGSVCRNARHVGGRTLVDIVVNEAQARALPDGQAIVARLDAALNGTSGEPIHVSTGLLCEPITANGTSNGKPHDRIATKIEYDHLAILLHEQGAGTPADQVGMWLNVAGQPAQVESVRIDTLAEDKRTAGLLGWVRRLLGNADELSLSAIEDGLSATLPAEAWITDVYTRYAIWRDEVGKYWRQDYAVSSEGALSWTGQPVEVERKVSFEEVTSNHEGACPVKDKIVAALNAAGVQTAGLDDAALLSAYNALTVRPVEDRLTAANSKLAAVELVAHAAADAELTTLATELQVNTSLTVADFRAMGLARCRELKTASKAAPVVTSNAGGGSGNTNPFAEYDINAINKEGA
jgi:hypothetical protein